MSTTEISQKILENLGGIENVTGVSQCATRLRFNLNDASLANEAALKGIKEVMGVMHAGGQYQVIIGNDVAKYYAEISKICDTNKPNQAGTKTVAKGESRFNQAMNYISGTMSSLIPPLVGSAILKGLLSILVTLKWLDGGSSTYAILSGASNAILYFLPIIVAFSAAKKLNVNPIVAACIGGALMEPSIAGLVNNTGDIVHFIGLPVMTFSYASSLFPSLLAVWLYSYVEKWLEKKCPKDLKLMAIPFVGLVLFVPLTLIVFGPFAFYVAKGVSIAYNAIFAFSPVITGSLIGALFPFLVIFGLHWAILPICVNDFATAGFSSLYGLWLGANLAQWSLPFGVAIGTKKKEERNVAFSMIFTLLFSGITEPVMFGYVLRNKKFIIPLVTAGAIGGGLLGLFNNVSHGFAFLNLFSLPLFKANGSTLLFVVIAVVEIIIGAILTKIYVFSKKNVSGSAYDNN